MIMGFILEIFVQYSSGHLPTYFAKVSEKDIWEMQKKKINVFLYLADYINIWKWNNTLWNDFIAAHKFIIHQEIVIYRYIFVYMQWFQIIAHLASFVHWSIFCRRVIYSSNSFCKRPAKYAYSMWYLILKGFPNLLQFSGAFDYLSFCLFFFIFTFFYIT